MRTRTERYLVERLSPPVFTTYCERPGRLATTAGGFGCVRRQRLAAPAVPGDNNAAAPALIDREPGLA